MGGKILTFDIWGSCVCRDSFGIPADHGKGICFSSKASLEGCWPDDSEFRYQIRNYFQNCSLKSQLMPQHGPIIEKDDIVSDQLREIDKNWICNDYNKDIFDKLENSGSEWLIVDFRAESYGSLQILNTDGTVDYISSPTLHRIDIFGSITN